MTSPRRIVRPLEKTDWPAIEALFGDRGACGGCWCMAWRRPGRTWEEHRGAGNKRAFKRLVTGGQAHGVLAFADGEPVGWCSVGPRADYASLATKWSLKTDWDEDTWSVTCFFIAREWRGRGLGKELLKAAVDVARKNGARRIEGYPVVPTKERMPAAFAWTGLPQMFASQGFTPLPDPPGKRPIYVRRLRPR